MPKWESTSCSVLRPSCMPASVMSAGVSSSARAAWAQTSSKAKSARRMCDGFYIPSRGAAAAVSLLAVEQLVDEGRQDRDHKERGGDLDRDEREDEERQHEEHAGE